MQSAVELTVGACTIQLQVYVGQDYDTDSSTVTVNAAPTNNPPVANTDNVTVEIDTPVTIDVAFNDTDPDGDPLTVTSVADAPNGSTHLNAASVTDVPALIIRQRAMLAGM